MNFIVRGVFLLLAFSMSSARADKVLDMDPVMQKSPVWCWVAVSEMVLRYYDVPNVNPAGVYQCGFIGLNSIATNDQACNEDCRKCNFPAGSAANLKRAFEEYPRRVAIVKNARQPRLNMTVSRSAASNDKIEDEIDNDRPFIIGITPSGSPMAGVSAHVAVVRGYRDLDGKRQVLVNDPFPFEATGNQNPYLKAGGEIEEGLSYWIDVDALRNKLVWRETMFVRKAGTYPKPAAAQIATRCVVNAYGNGCMMAPGIAISRGAQCNCFGMPGIAY